jgi:C4-dicarboxylate anaerobic carrier
MVMSSEVQAPDDGVANTATAEDAGGGAGEGAGEGKSRFTLPSAYTILFALIVLTAIATWIIPAGQYDLDTEGSPIPGTYHEIDAHPSASSSTR